MLKKLVPFTKKYKLYAILTPIMVICQVLLEIRIPLLMADIVDNGIPSKDIIYISKIGGIMVLMALFSLTFGVLGAKFGSIASMGFGSELRRGLFDKVQEFSFSNVDKYSTASLVTRLTTDVNNLQNAFMMTIRILVRAPFMLISATIMAYFINKNLIVIFLIAIPFLAIAFIAIAYFAFPRFSIMLKNYDKINGSLQENLIAIRVVKAFVRSAYEKGKFKLTNEKLTQATIHAEKVVISSMPIMQLTMYGCIVAILWFGGLMIIDCDMLTGELISFITYVSQILISLMMISMVFIQIVLSRASANRINEVLDEVIDIKDSLNKNDIKAKDGSIIFKDVSFKYNENSQVNNLEDINLEIHSGQTIGIIGGTGSAKTTLVQLIPRLYDVTGGKVLVGGHDVRDYKLEHLRDAVSVVLQKNVLFSGTIKQNLKWGNPKATDDEIIEACKAAQAHDFISSFTDGYDTMLGQGGVNVSGGQKQRICIARALLKKPKVLILDDSTSAVDTATDAKIREMLNKYKKDLTVIIIAQRITSVSDADRIIVLDEGKINAIGTHKALLETNEIYSEVYHSQQNGVA